MPDSMYQIPGTRSQVPPMTFTVALVGRPNVGKSTLFNRLTGKRHALTDDQPGVTRDRRFGKANLAGLEFSVVDTAGLDDAKEGTLAARMTAQSEQAIHEADIALFIIDGRAGVTPADRHFAQALRKGKTPVLVVVNKAEGGRASHTISEAHGLGFGEPVAISAEHGEGMVDLYEALCKSCGERSESTGSHVAPDPAHSLRDSQDEVPLQIAIVGRPNAGKSTLINKILGYERVITGPEAGITRDAIMIEHAYKGRKLKLSTQQACARKPMWWARWKSLPSPIR